LREFEFDLERENIESIITKLKSYPNDIKKVRLKVPSSLSFQKVAEAKSKILKETEFVAYIEEKTFEQKTKLLKTEFEIAEENIFKIYREYFLEKKRKEEDFKKIIAKIEEITNSPDE
jgi:malate synthase